MNLIRDWVGRDVIIRIVLIQITILEISIHLIVQDTTDRPKLPRNEEHCHIRQSGFYP